MFFISLLIRTILLKTLIPSKILLPIKLHWRYCLPILCYMTRPLWSLMTIDNLTTYYNVHNCDSIEDITDHLIHDSATLISHVRGLLPLTLVTLAPVIPDSTPRLHHYVISVYGSCEKFTSSQRDGGRWFKILNVISFRWSANINNWKLSFESCDIQYWWGLVPLQECWG